MAKFLKRIGTKKIIYEYEILVEKIEIKLSAPCQLAVLMKRGLKTDYFLIFSNFSMDRT